MTKQKILQGFIFPGFYGIKELIINFPGVMGFISFPADFDKNKKYPTIFLFHGGPEGAWTANYTNYLANVHLMAARGYITVKINLHGSSSYGLAFQEAILGNWGIVDVEDVLKGLDYLLKEYPCIDPGRIAGLGRSYGGFLVNYLNGKTNRFKCFISVDGIFDQVLGYYTTDELWFMESEFKGTPFTSPEIYKRSSPRGKGTGENFVYLFSCFDRLSFFLLILK